MSMRSSRRYRRGCVPWTSNRTLKVGRSVETLRESLETNCKTRSATMKLLHQFLLEDIPRYIITLLLVCIYHVHNPRFALLIYFTSSPNPIGYVFSTFPCEKDHILTHRVWESSKIYGNKFKFEAHVRELLLWFSHLIRCGADWSG